jgi:phospholipid/cholesterol/gamma-HCH transport system substrate-binding protein
MSAHSVSWFKVRRRLVGLVFLLVFAVLVWLSIALYNKQFTPVALVTLNTDTVGNELHVHAEVKLRGVVVGEVRQISSTGAGAQLQLAIQPNMVPKLPANVSAELLPTTLFGERYVDLVMPAEPDQARLTAGSVISQDRSSSAIELEKVFTDLMPMLQAVQPQKLSATLTAVSDALAGRGRELGQTLVNVNTYLRAFNPNLTALDNDISQFVAVTQEYANASPNILQALTDFAKTGQTFVQQQQQLNQLYATVTASAQDLTTFLQVNQDNLIRLSADSTGTLRLLARYSPEFPCTLRDLVAFEPAMDRVLGKGTSEPGLHVTADVVPSLGRYVPGRDTPKYGDDTGPQCYPVPFPGVGLNDGTSQQGQFAGPANPAAAVNLPTGTSAGGLGLANSPQENELINELVAPSIGRSPQSLPDWTSVLLGPIYRGSEVTVK